MQTAAQAQEPQRRAHDQLVALTEDRGFRQHRPLRRMLTRIDLGVAVWKQLEDGALRRQREQVEWTAPRRQGDATGRMQPSSVDDRQATANALVEIVLGE